MARLLMRLGGLLIFTRKEQKIRGSFLILLTNALVLAGLIFTLEIVLIFLGVGNVFLPLTGSATDFLTRVIF